MLSRVADTIYWMSRYLERAEHTARLLDVNLLQMLDETDDFTDQRWERLLSSLKTALPEGQSIDSQTVTAGLTFDASNASSVAGCIAASRENARQAREQISSEMWEQLNSLYLEVRDVTVRENWHTEPHAFLRSVKEGAHLFQGITDATMSHGEGWLFIQLGRWIERATATAALLDTHISASLEDGHRFATPPNYQEWVGLLKSCTAFEAYCKVHTAEIRPEAITEFLLLNAEFPRSVRFVVDQMQNSLQAIGRVTGASTAGRAERLTGRLRATLDYGQVDEILAGDVHGYLRSIQQQCLQIEAAIYEAYITYPIERMLAS